jgi:hypothetical protein
MSSQPPSPGYFSDNPYQTPQMQQGMTPQAYYGPRRGMVNQVRIVAILNGVQGALELFMGAMMLLMGGIFTAMPASEFKNPNDQQVQFIMQVFMFSMGGIVTLLALLRIAAAVMNFMLLGRMFAIVMVCIGLATAMTGYCSITSIAVAIYTLIVLFNREVAEAFTMRASGSSADEVLATFNARPW